MFFCSVSVEYSAAHADKAMYATVTKNRKKKGTSLDTVIFVVYLLQVLYYLMSSTDHRQVCNSIYTVYLIYYLVSKFMHVNAKTAVVQSYCVTNRKSSNICIQ